MSSWEFFIWNSISRDSDGIFSKISPKQLLQSTFLLKNFQYKLMNTRTLVKPIIICLLFAEIFMVGLTMLKIGFTIRIYLQDEQNPLSGFGRILFGPRSFRGCGSPVLIFLLPPIHVFIFHDFFSLKVFVTLCSMQVGMITWVLLD